MEPLDPFCYCDQLADNSIRLLQVLQGSGDEPLTCRLKDYVFRDLRSHRLNYNTLSYTWGRRPATEKIICNGLNLSVTENLYKALWNIRQSGNHGFWWVDAICINQANVAEKTVQVRRMIEIYSRSRRVFAWLGEEDLNTSKVVKLMHKLYDLMSGPLRATVEANLDLNTEAFGLPPTTDAVWSGVFEFLGRPWFHRVWIVQEIASAPEGVFMCGSHLIPLRVVFSASWTILRFHNLQLARIMSNDHIDDQIAQSPTAAILEVSRNAYRSGIKFEIAHLMQMTAAFKSTQPRDKVFALAALSSDVPVEFIDYQKSLDSIHIDVMKIALSNPAKFDLLANTCFNRSIKDLPSWVPDLSNHAFGFASLRLVFRHDQAVVVGEPKFRWDTQDALFADGKIIDSVKKIIHDTPYQTHHTQILESYSTYQSYMNLMDKWLTGCETLLDPKSQYADGSPVTEAFWRALIFDTGPRNVRATKELYPAYRAYREIVRICATGDYQRTPEEQRMYEILSSGKAFRRDEFLTNSIIGGLVGFLATSAFTGRWPRSLSAWTRAFTFGLASLTAMHLLLLKCPYAVTQQDEDAEDMEAKKDKFAYESRPLEQSMMMFTNGRKFFLSKRGFIGWVPCNTQEGDKICIFQGCRIPFAIRELQDGFQLLGDCYIQGLMDGQAWTSSSTEVTEIKLI